MHTERQQQIVERSMDLIAEKGIQGFTIKNLATAIGISEPAIYRHFESKTEILLAILEGFKELGGAMAIMLAGSNASALEKVETLFAKMLEVFTSKPSVLSVIFSEEIFKNEEELKHKIVEVQNIFQANIERIIAKGQENGDLRSDIDRSSLALIFMGALRLLVKRWDLNGRSFDLRKEGEKLIAAFKTLTR